MSESWHMTVSQQPKRKSLPLMYDAMKMILRSIQSESLLWRRNLWDDGWKT